MAIKADRHGNYGGTAVVTQKYSPLHNIDYKSTDESVYSALLTNRINLLTAANIMPRRLRLMTDWTTSLAEGSKDPPLVVISTNRSNWIAGGLHIAKEQHKKTSYEGSNDLKALSGKVDGQTQSPPLYAPQRTEGERKIFIVVHAYEYKTYRAALAGSNITVVGWSFEPPRATTPELTGFGPSRYAAIEFCKHVRRNKAGEKWDYAWLLDDNVVGITGFPGYKKVEEALAAAVASAAAAAAAAEARREVAPDTTPVCSAFHGGAGVIGFGDTKKWAEKEVDARPSRGKPTVLPPSEATRGIIQQTALWNIKYLDEQKLNFAPLFITSGEDVSLGNFFNLVIPAKTTEPPDPGKPAVPYLYYGGLKVWKEDVGLRDESDGSKKVNAARGKYQKWFADTESGPTATGATAPPPVSIALGEGATATVTTLKKFIADWFDEPLIKNKPAGVKTDDVNERHKAGCQAVEQIVCGAIKAGYVTKVALNRTFTIPGADGQVIQPFPPPPEE